jgi:hypothetical protein
MWDIDVIATQRHNDLLRRSAQRRLAARAKAAAAAKRGAGLEPARPGARARFRARRTLGFALVQAGLWILVGGGRHVRDEQFERLARDPELESARASAPHRS